MKTYRSAFFVALAGNVLLAGALVFSGGAPTRPARDGCRD